MASLKDVAGVTGLSMATVSRALNERPGIRRATRERVLRAAASLGYQPNLIAKGLVSGQVNSIAVVIPPTSKFLFLNPFYGETIQGIARAAALQGYYLVFLLGQAQDYAQPWRQGIARGVIVVANTIDDPALDDLRRHRVPTVLIPGVSKSGDLPFVDVDNPGGARQAVGFLLQQGHRRIAFLNGAPSYLYSTERLAGFRSAYRQARIPLAEDLILETDFSRDSGRVAAQKLVQLPREERPTAILTVNYLTALGALDGIQELGARVPEDVSLMSFGSVPEEFAGRPQVTCVEEPFAHMGETAVRLLLLLMEGRPQRRPGIVLPVRLRIGETTAETRAPADETTPRHGDRRAHAAAEPESRRAPRGRRRLPTR